MPDWVSDFQQAELARAEAGKVDGRHYAEFVPEVQALLKAGDEDAAAGLLLRLIDAVEREAQIQIAGCTGVPPWYFEQLAAIYKKRGMAAERGRLIQRQMLLQVKAETEGRIAKIRMDAAVAGELAGGGGGSHAKVSKRKTPRPRQTTVAAAKAGRAAGRAVGMLARILGLK